MTATVAPNETTFYTLPPVWPEPQKERTSFVPFSAIITNWFVGTENVRLDKRFLRGQKLLDGLDRLAVIRKLPSNWDSHGAAPIADPALTNAFDAIQQLATRDVFPNKISPTDEGGIILEYHFSGASYYWEFDSDGDIGLLKTGVQGEYAADFSGEEIRARRKGSCLNSQQQARSKVSCDATSVQLKPVE